MAKEEARRERRKGSGESESGAMECGSVGRMGKGERRLREKEEVTQGFGVARDVTNSDRDRRVKGH